MLFFLSIPLLSLRVLASTSLQLLVSLVLFFFLVCFLLFCWVLFCVCCFELVFLVFTLVCCFTAVKLCTRYTVATPTRFVAVTIACYAYSNPCAYNCSLLLLPFPLCSSLTVNQNKKPPTPPLFCPETTKPKQREGVEQVLHVKQ